MELAQDELNKNAKIAEWKLKSKLDIALDGVEDVNKDNLKLALLSHSLSTQLSLIHAPPPEDNKTMLNSTVFAKEKDSKLTGFGCFTLDYKAQWPVSLVLSRKALTQYQLLFRLLFYCKRVRNGLDNAWLWHQSMKELPHVRALLAHTFLLRQRYISTIQQPVALGRGLTQGPRMLHVVTTLERYFLLDVVEPNWRLLEKRVREAATVEQILSFHNDCINSSLRQCLLTDIKLFKSTHNEREIIERVESVHGWANAQLLDLIVHKSELISHLRSLKQYFLLEQGNWVENFMELAQDELNKNAKIAEWKLKSKLDIALDGVEDVNKDNLKLALLSHSLSTQLSLIHAPPPEDNKTMLNSTVFAKEKDSKLTGFGCFTLDYKAQWPVSLVLSRKALTQYQLLFRLLFYCKRVRNGLDNAWLWHQSMKELPHGRRMLHVVTTLERYFLLDVVEPNWRLLEKRVREAATVEQILSFHNDCINSSLRQCLLTDIKLFKMVDRALTACHVFTSYMATCAKHIDSTDTALNINLSLKQRSAKMKESASSVRAVVESAKYQASITQLRDKFCKYTDELVSALASLPTTTYDSHMSLLAERLRFDGA
ncbi:Spc97 / Spc98 family protein [Acanthamoeba castellanii str. Neff]|uniref:Spindle pole body component n=1 Tax=Acanthamoeba castellanii (strain ATCC 30010 / Neff) TaxID=1257118 RepID=L8GQN1_ACACF|nr:Spc97 / Spc98 family protein [Acanthamoeba castellanii str. Neff]ELR15469.1 Spc97 / Spc98 family protein [Acanthamoeba castellanii str. Neff]